LLRAVSQSHWAADNSSLATLYFYLIAATFFKTASRAFSAASRLKSACFKSLSASSLACWASSRASWAALTAWSAWSFLDLASSSWVLAASKAS